MPWTFDAYACAVMDSGQGVCVTHAAAGSDVVVLSGGEILVGVHTVIGYRLHTVLCEEEVVLVLVASLAVPTRPDDVACCSASPAQVSSSVSHSGGGTRQQHRS